MYTFHGNPRIKAEILRNLQAQLISPERMGQSATGIKRRKNVCANSVESQLTRLTIEVLPGTLVRLAAEIEMSYTAHEVRARWNYDFVGSIAPGAILSNVWRDYASFRFDSSSSLLESAWLSDEQRQSVRNVSGLLHEQCKDPRAWRSAAQRIADCILVIDLGDRRRHGLGPVELHKNASELVSRIAKISDSDSTDKIAYLANDTAQLAYGLIDPYWKDNRHFIDAQALKLLQLVKAVSS